MEEMRLTDSCVVAAGQMRRPRPVAALVSAGQCRRRCARRRDLTPGTLLLDAELSIRTTDFPTQSIASVTVTHQDAWSLGVVL